MSGLLEQLRKNLTEITENMSLNFTDMVKQGPVKLKQRNTAMALWKSRYVILRRASSRGALRLECYRSERMSQLTDDGVTKVFDLTKVRSVTLLPPNVKRNALSINCSNDATSIHLAFDNESEAMTWQVALQSNCFPPSRPLTAPLAMDLLNCASESSSQDAFNAYLLPSASLSMTGECLLQCTTETLFLLDVENPNRRLVGWSLSAIRRYGKDNNRFTFESGRCSSTGEGIFIFNTIHSEEIYTKIHNASLAISNAYRLKDTEQGSFPAHRPLVKTETFPIPQRHLSVDEAPVAVPPRPRPASSRSHVTMDRRRPLPPSPPTDHT